MASPISWYSLVRLRCATAISSQLVVWLTRTCDRILFVYSINGGGGGNNKRQKIGGTVGPRQKNVEFGRTSPNFRIHHDNDKWIWTDPPCAWVCVCVVRTRQELQCQCRRMGSLSYLLLVGCMAVLGVSGLTSARNAEDLHAEAPTNSFAVIMDAVNILYMLWRCYAGCYWSYWSLCMQLIASLCSLCMSVCVSLSLSFSLCLRDRLALGFTSTPGKPPSPSKHFMK